jgi:hypothetical protein
LMVAPRTLQMALRRTVSALKLSIWYFKRHTPGKFYRRYGWLKTDVSGNHLR